MNVHSPTRPIPSRGKNAHQTTRRWLTGCTIAGLWVLALIVTVGMFYSFNFMQAPLWMTPLAAAPAAAAAYAHKAMLAGRHT